MQDVWIFGYGSLIWRADFPYAESRPANIKGWARRFWQGSTDHRGVPGAPGRVVTLVAAPGETCWGVAYRLIPDQLDQTLDHLDYREKGGYERLNIAIGFTDGSTVEGITYHATADNRNYLGEASIASVANQIVGSSGPSGHNIEYVLRLREALEAMQAKDDHVFEIAEEVLRLVGTPG